MKKYNRLFTSVRVVLIFFSLGTVSGLQAGNRSSSVLKLYNQPESPGKSDGWNEVLPEEGESPVQLVSARISKVPTTNAAKTYVVRKGDTIFGVAKRNGVSAQQFMKINKLSESSVLRQGQKVIISPAKGRATNPQTRHGTSNDDADSIPHTVKKGETLSKIANTYGISASSLVTVNRFPEGATLLPGRVIRIPVQGQSASRANSPNVLMERPVSVSRQSYQVKGQDTFYSLARYYGVTVKELRDANPGVDPTKLKEGMTLKIPVKGQRVKNEIKEDVEEEPANTPEPTARELHSRAPKITTKSRMKLGDTVIVDEHSEIKSHTVDPYFEYTVEPGDTWEAIAADFKTSVLEIQRINRMENTELENGFTLQVPRTRLAPKTSKPSLAHREG